MLMTPTEFAKSQGFTAPYVYELIHKGHIIPVDGKIDEDQAVAALAALQTVGMPATRKGQPTHDHAFKQAKDTGPGTSPAAASPTSQVSPAAKATELSTVLLKTRIKNEVEKGKLLEVEAKLKTGQVLDAQIVEKEAFQAARTVREALQNIPDRVASLLASLSDANQIYDILAKEIRTALEGLADELEAE